MQRRSRCGSSASRECCPPSRSDDERYGTKGSSSQRQSAAQDELGFRGPDCNVIAEQGGGPDAGPSWAGSGPQAGGCPPML